MFSSIKYVHILVILPRYLLIIRYLFYKYFFFFVTNRVLCKVLCIHLLEDFFMVKNLILFILINIFVAIL